MKILSRTITRRTFLKRSSQLLGYSYLFVNHRIQVVAANLQVNVSTGYGRGNYSVGEYPGYKTYLPVITKGN